MNVDVVFLPSLLTPAHVRGRNVVVFDVLRATTSMTAALAAGVAEIRVYPTLAAAATGAGPAGAGRLLCGEENCLAPAGFDLGNSPGAFTSANAAGRTMHLSTTNGTRAIVAARGAATIFSGALVNASFVARALAARAHDVTLLCAGTGGAIALEDVLGAGAVLHALQKRGGAQLESDAALMALRLFRGARDDLRASLAQSRGGENVRAAGLDADIDFAARLDAIDVVGVIEETTAEPPVVKPLSPN